MSAQLDAKEAPELHEGSWAYLSLGAAEGRGDRQLFRHVIDACESSGWSAVSWSPAPRADGDSSDFARFLDGMSHAVAHADVVVAFIDGSSDMAEMELDFAYEHRRPIVGLRISRKSSAASEAQDRLRSYDRARLVECDGVEECVAGLREALSDPEFSATIGEAAGEPPRHV